MPHIHPPVSKTMQRVSAGNILANHENQSPTPILRGSTHGATVLDRLASNIGLLRTMFKENAQKPLCPHIDEIGPAIVSTFHLTDPKDVSDVYELLVMSQRATGHPIADFEALCKILRSHTVKRDTTARKTLVKNKQMLALRGMKNAGAMGAAAAGSSDATAGTSTTTPRLSTPTRSKALQAAGGVPPPPAARSQSDWIAFLNQFSSKADGRLNWTEFAGAIANLPSTWRRGGQLEPVDSFGARAFFMSVASVENLPQGTGSRVTTAGLSTYFTGNKVIARTSKSVALGSTIRSAMSWEDNSGAPSSARYGGVSANVGAIGNTKEQTTSATATPRANIAPGENRAVRLRNEAQKRWIVEHLNDPATTAEHHTKLPKI